jgi:hypothetical protein
MKGVISGRALRDRGLLWRYGGWGNGDDLGFYRVLGAIIGFQ